MTAPKTITVTTKMTPGQLAHEAFCKALPDDTPPRWEDTPAEIRAAFEAAAEVVYAKGYEDGESAGRQRERYGDRQFT